VQPKRLVVMVAGLAASVAMSPVTAAVALASDPAVVVVSGDTLTGISKRHGVPIQRIVQLNGLANPDRIYPGQRLLLTAPAPAPRPAPAATAARAAGPATAAAPAPRTHLVQRGENLTVIARHYGVTVAAIVAANGIANPSRIFAGQQLQIPGAAPAPASAKPAGMSAAMSRLVAARAPIRDLIAAEAQRYGVPVALALAVAWQESGWRQEVVSSAGAIGVMQLLPSTADWVGGAMLGERLNVYDLGDNVRAGVCLLAHYLERYGGSVDLALAAYYQGQTAADRHGVYGITRPYIASIRLLMTVFGG
jgi:soluble lytic murein transglycosylase-like protein